MDGEGAPGRSVCPKEERGEAAGEGAGGEAVAEGFAVEGEGLLAGGGGGLVG